MKVKSNIWKVVLATFLVLATVVSFASFNAQPAKAIVACDMTITIPADAAAEGAKVEIAGKGTYGDGAIVNLQSGINISWRLWLHSQASQWYTKPVDCTVLAVTTEYCVMAITIPDDAVAEGAKVEIAGVGTYANGKTVILPKGINIQWRLWLHSQASQWYTKNVDCSALVVDPDKYCVMAITIPAEAVAEGAKVEIAGVGTYVNGATVILPVCVNISWRLWAHSQASPWSPKHVDCTPLEASKITIASYCVMKIVIPAEAVAEGAKVEIAGVGTYGDGQTVVLPSTIGIQWRLWLHSQASQWYKKYVDCTPLVVDKSQYCVMAITIPENAAAEGAKVEIAGVGTYASGQTVILPVSINIQWRLWLHSQASAWYTKHVDCTPLDVGPGFYCVMAITIPEDAAAEGAKVEIAGVGTYASGQTVILPVSIKIQWRLWLHSQASQWYTKPVECTELAVKSADYCVMKITIADSAGKKVEIGGVGTYNDGQTVILPSGSKVNWRLWTGSQAGPWINKTVDCSGIVT